MIKYQQILTSMVRFLRAYNESYNKLHLFIFLIGSNKYNIVLLLRVQFLRKNWFYTCQPYQQSLMLKTYKNKFLFLRTPMRIIVENDFIRRLLFHVEAITNVDPFVGKQLNIQ